jgi:hypothetical protein
MQAMVVRSTDDIFWSTEEPYMPPELNERLRAFLDDRDIEKEEGITLRNIADALMAHISEDRDERHKDRQTFEEHRRQFYVQIEKSEQDRTRSEQDRISAQEERERDRETAARHHSAIKSTLDIHANRIERLEKARTPSGSELVPFAEKEEPSFHEWNDLLAKAGAALSQRVKDPKDRMDSLRAAAIAKDVLAASQTESKAKAYDAWMNRSGKVAFEIVKLALAAGAGLLAAKYGLHIL